MVHRDTPGEVTLCRSHRVTMSNKAKHRLERFAPSVVLGTAIWLLPTPSGVHPEATHLLAIFVATIIGIILKPIPMGAVAMIGICATALTNTLDIAQALSGFGNRVIWLIVLAFFISRGFIKTGLGARIAYLFMVWLGRRTLGLGYGLIATDLVLAPAIPSNTARAGGVIFPILKSVARAYGSDPDDGTSKRIGSFLTVTSFQGTVITSAMFLTAMAANPLAAELAADQGVAISWTNWALAAVLPGLVSLVAVPYLLYKLHRPEITETPEARSLAKEKLAEMGPVTASEWVMLCCFILLLTLWILGARLSLHTTVTALLGLALLLVTGVLSWDDILKEKGAWDTLVWFSALVMMASYLNDLGLIPWFSAAVGGLFRDVGWLPAFAALGLIYFYSHYFFASNTAHVSSMYAPFLGVALVLGTPPLLAALVLGYFSNLFSSMTHYGTGPAPVLFGSGYVDIADWWRLGLLVSFVNLGIWLIVGGLWWRLLGYW